MIPSGPWPAIIVTWCHSGTGFPNQMIQHLNQTTFFSSSNSLQNFVAMNTRQQPICLSGDHLSFLKPCLQWPKEPDGHPTFDPSAACCARVRCGDFGRVEVAADRRDQLGDLCPPSVTLVVPGPGAAMAHGPGAGPNQAGPSWEWYGMVDGACWGSVDRELFWNGQNDPEWPEEFCLHVSCLFCLFSGHI